MSSRESICTAREHVRGMPARDIYTLLLRIDMELDPGNDGLLHISLKEAQETLSALLRDLEGAAPHQVISRVGHPSRHAAERKRPARSEKS